MPTVHPSAVLSGDCDLADSVEIGPGCVLAGPVRLAEGVRLLANVHLRGPVTIGPRTILYPFACLGFEPQDYKFKPGAPTAGVVVGADCLIREHATVHAASNETAPTTIGDRVFMMVASHVGHDARVGNGVVMVNYAGVSGHADIADNATLSGHVGIHQFVRVGRLAFISGGVAVSKDVPPFCMAPERNRIGGLNLVGMRRAGIPRHEITEVRRAFRDVFRAPVPHDEALDILRERATSSPAVAELADFVAGTKRGICPGMGRPPRLLTTWLQMKRRGVTLPDFDEDE